MFAATDEKRLMKRKYIEPYDSGIFLILSLNGESHKFNLLDVSPGGIGMLVRDDQKGILKKLQIGSRLDMEYGTPYATISTKFEVIHITNIERGSFKGHYQVGLLFISNPD